jgi:hypothetical protein
MDFTEDLMKGQRHFGRAFIGLFFQILPLGEKRELQLLRDV